MHAYVYKQIKNSIYVFLSLNIIGNRKQRPNINYYIIFNKDIVDNTEVFEKKKKCLFFLSLTILR